MTFDDEPTADERAAFEAMTQLERARLVPCCSEVERRGVSLRSIDGGTRSDSRELLQPCGEIDLLGRRRDGNDDKEEESIHVAHFQELLIVVNLVCGEESHSAPASVTTTISSIVAIPRPGTGSRGSIVKTIPGSRA